MSEKKQPDVRFKGFYGDWKKKEFLNAFDSSIPTNTLSRANLNYEQGAVKNIHYGDVLIKFGEITDVLKEEIPFITDADITKYKNQFLENGDIIFADAAEDETVGKVTEISGITDERVVSGLHTIACRPIDTSSTGYWGYYLNSSAYHNQLLPVMQGIKVLSISKRSLATTFVNYPNEENEQVKIGELFKNLDNLIALNQSKYDKLVRMKKACLEKMFPKDGADIPEIRFKGFSGKWEERKLGDCIEDLKSGLSRMLSNEDIGLPVVRANNINDGKLDMDNDVKYWYKEDPQGADTNNYLIKKSDMLINFINSEAKMGTATIVENEPHRAMIYTTNILRLRTNKICDNNFLLALTMTRDYKEYIKGISKTAVNQASFTTVDYKNYNMKVPSIKEQQQLGSFFRNLDSLITLRKTELDKLKNIKKALLEKMFI